MFESAYSKIKRAEQHITELEALYRKFFQSCGYEVLSDFDKRAGGYGLRIETTGKLPLESAVIMGDVAHNLRSALDHVAVEIELKAPKPRKIKDIKFPSRKGRQEYITEVDGGVIKATFPKTADIIRDDVNCCAASNNLLWIIGQLNKLDKHRYLLTDYAVTKISGIDAYDERYKSRISDITGVVENGCVLGMMIFQGPITVTNKGTASFSVQFDEVGLLEGDPVIPTLIRMAREVTIAVDLIENAFEVELKSLGMFA